MRLVFFSLVFLNIVVTVWWGLSGSGEPHVSNAKVATNANLFGTAPPLVLIDERKDKLELAAQSELGKSQEGSTRETNKPEQRPLCTLVGPFSKTSQAADFLERLKAIEISSTIKDIDLPAGEGYWVYLEPEANQKVALRRLSELQARGVDSYVIPKGSLENGISLGVYSQKEIADARVKDMKAIGLDPKIDVIERSYREVWVMLDHKEDEKVSELTWQRITEDMESMERRQNFCLLDVASKENFH